MAEADDALQLPAAPALAAALLPFQREGVAAAIRAGGRLLIADDMGLGKTLQGLAVAAHYASEWPLLIVVPSSLRWPWVDACEQWCDKLLRPSSCLNVCLNGGNTRLCDPSVRIHIVTYALLANEAIQRQLAAARFGVVIADESHYVKSAKAQRTAVLLPLLRAARRCILLSGTPALSRPVDLYTQLDAVAPGAFGSFSAFGQRYCAARRRPWGMDYSGASNLGELHARLSDGLMVRRLKADVLDQLPPKRRECVRLELAAAAAAETAAAAAALRGKWADAGKAERSGDVAAQRSARNDAQRAMQGWWTSTASAKAAAVAAHVVETLDGCSDKLLVFAHHRSVLDALEDAVRAARVPYIRMDGATPSRDRHELVQRFQTDAAVRVALLSVTACGQGLTLTASSHVIMAELCWTPAVLLQAEDRAHRIGQRAAVNVRYLIAPGTVDDVMWPLLSRKLRCLGRALDGRAAGLDVSQRIEEDAPGDEAQEGAVMDEAAALFCATDGAAGGAAAGAAKVQARPLDAEDIRSFFGGGAAKRAKRAPAADAGPSSQSDAAAVAAAAAPPRGWDCGRCTLLNARCVARCEACDAPRPSAAQRAAATAAAPQQQEAEVIDLISDDDDDAAAAAATARAQPARGDAAEPAAGAGAEPACAPPICALSFEVSEHTGRVFVHVDDVYSGESFLPAELEVLAAAEAQAAAEAASAPDAPADDEASRLPRSLSGAAALRQARAFVREWQALRAVTQRALCAQLLRPPLARAAAAAAASAKRARPPPEDADAGGSCQRFSTMERFLSSPCAANNAAGSAAATPSPAADDGVAAQGEVRTWTAAGGRTVRQRFVGREPVCLHCGELYADATRQRLGSACCGSECAAALRVLTQSGAARAQLRALERGVCALCRLDTLALLQELRALPTPHERARRLAAAGWAERRAAACAAAPTEGALWQADHERAVAEGGGEADLAAYRTLCDPCHLRQTAALRGRLRAAELAVAAKCAPDIRALLGGPKSR